MCGDSDTEEEWGGSVFSEFGDTDDDGAEGESKPELSPDGWDSDAEVG